MSWRQLAVANFKEGFGAICWGFHASFTLNAVF